jgi:hypothetical protein
MIDTMGFGGWGIGGNFNGFSRRTFSLTDSLSWSKGNHLFVAGMDVLGARELGGTDWGQNPFVWGGVGYSAMNSDANFLLGYAQVFIQGSGQYLDG